MKKFYRFIIVISLLCSNDSIEAQAPPIPAIRKWSGLGDGHTWNDPFNWNYVWCTDINGFINAIYTVPATGEVVEFLGVGDLSITGCPIIQLGNVDYNNYGYNHCGTGVNSTLNLFSMQILDFSNVTLDCDILAGGYIGSTNGPGISEAFRIQNASLTCSSIAGNYAQFGSSESLNMNSIYAENSTINCIGPGNSASFSPSGNTRFNNCTINAVSFSPYSNNDFPTEKDEFVSCIINTGRVQFGAKCIAIATNCFFNISATNNPQFSLNTYSTLNNVTLNNIQINVDTGATGGFYIGYKPGASVINGNINCNSTDPDFQITFSNNSNIPSFPIKINGNMIFTNGSIAVSNQGTLDITGNLEMNGTADANLNKSVSANNQTVFQIGGVSNYANYNSGPYGPIPGGSRFGIKFSGAGDSHIIWPTGFPADTLVIEKTGCGKVYIDNQPLHVTGKLHVKSGQLILYPMVGLPYVMVNGANTQIDAGGSILLNTDGSGNKSHIALGGDLVDVNMVNNPATCNGFNNVYAADVAFYNNQYSPVSRIIGISNIGSIGNLKLINTTTDPYNLTTPLTVQNIDFGSNGKIMLGNNNLLVNGGLTGFNASKFIITDGTGKLVLKNIGITSTIFPVGISSSSYTPLTIANNGTTDDFGVRVQSGVLSGGTTGTAISNNVVNRTWMVEETVAGGSNVLMTSQWNSVDELPGFNRNEVYLAHYRSLNWNTGSLSSAVGGGPYTITRIALSSFSPFAVLGNGSVAEFIDEDNDGYPVGLDCNDADATMNPGATEICDGKDNDCNGTIDNGVLTTYYPDADVDGYGSSSLSIQSCSQPAGYVTTAGDCNDNNAAVHPEATEICGNGIDDNCNGQIDEGCTVSPLISINDVTVYESQGIVTLTVSLSKTSTQAIKINYTNVDGTALSKGKGKNPIIDYIAAKGTLIIPAGSLTGTIVIVIVNDGLTEPAEYFDVQLSIIKNVNATISDGSGRVTILDGIAPLTTSEIITTSAKQNNGIKTIEVFEAVVVKVFPNPTTNQFQLQIGTVSKEEITARVMDVLGRQVKMLKAQPYQLIQFGNELKPGVYLVEIEQGTNRKVIKLVKQ